MIEKKRKVVEVKRVLNLNWILVFFCQAGHTMYRLTVEAEQWILGKLDQEIEKIERRRLKTAWENLWHKFHKFVWLSICSIGEIDQAVYWTLPPPHNVLADGAKIQFDPEKSLRLQFLRGKIGVKLFRVRPALKGQTGLEYMRLILVFYSRKSGTARPQFYKRPRKVRLINDSHASWNVTSH